MAWAFVRGRIYQSAQDAFLRHLKKYFRRVPGFCIECIGVARIFDLIFIETARNGGVHSY